jgi:hypothetical protein
MSNSVIFAVRFLRGSYESRCCDLFAGRRDPAEEMKSENRALAAHFSQSRRAKMERAGERISRGFQECFALLAES